MSTPAPTRKRERLGLSRCDVEALSEEDRIIERPADQGENPWNVARDDHPLHMCVKGCCIHVGLMDIEVVRRGFVLNDIVTEGARLLPKVRAGKFPLERDELV